MTKLTSILMACLLLATTAVKAGHYLVDTPSSWAGFVTIGYNVPSEPAFNGYYSAFDVQINGRPSGKKMRVLHLVSTVDSNGKNNDADQVKIAQSNNVGDWIAGDCDVHNWNTYHSGAGCSTCFVIQSWQPNCDWYTDIINAFKLPGGSTSADCNTVLFFDGLGYPLAAFDPTGWQFPTPSTTPTHFFGHRVDPSKPLTFGPETMASINAAIAPSWYTLYKF